MKRVEISNLVIELTRRCNMSCSHCMRGDVQCIDIEDSYIENVFKRVDRIGELTLTGGEPSIVPEKIQSVIRLAKKHNVYIGSFYIATNAKEVSKDFIIAVMDLYVYCDYSEGCMLQYSNDKFHDEVDIENTLKLEAFKFASAKDRKNYPLAVEQLLNQGRAFYSWGAWKEVSIHSKDITDGVIDGTMYLNAVGNIVPECDLSFDSQDCEYLIICNVSKDDFDIIEAVYNYNDRIEKACEYNGVTEIEFYHLEDMVV